jgi:hypothetical protein
MAAEPALLQKIINFLSKRSGMGVDKHAVVPTLHA